MPVNNQELLIDHLDSSLQGRPIAQAEALLQSNAGAREEWQYLQSAVDAVRHSALHARVAAIRAEWQPAPVVPVKKPVVRSIASRVFRIAAAVVLAVGALAVYKYVTTSADNYYKEHFTSYELSTSRSGTETTQIEQAFRSHNWSQVTSLYNAIATKTNKDHFLAGMAALELKQHLQAIARFRAVLNNNKRTGDNYFNDEAEFYLAFAYLGIGNANEAGQLLRKIEADKDHLYQQKAKEMSGIDLKVLEMKSEPVKI